MKKGILCALASAAATAALPLAAFASDGTAQSSGKTVWEKIGDNIWYILLVIAFGAGLIIINRWQMKIKKRDEEFKKEYEDWKKDNPEKAMELEEGDYCPPEYDPNAAADAGSAQQEQDELSSSDAPSETGSDGEGDSGEGNGDAGGEIG